MRHAALLREWGELRAADACQLAQAAGAARDAYLQANRTALLAERDHLRAQLVDAAARITV